MIAAGTILVLVTTGASDTSAHGAHDAHPAEIHGSPAAAVNAYFEGRDRGSRATIRTAFYPDAALQWVTPDGTPQILEQAEWWMRLDGKRPAAHNDQVLLDREGDMALVEASSRWPTHEFRDLLILAHTPDGWRIVGKVFTRLAPGATIPPATPEDEEGIREAVRVKIEAHAEYDPALLIASHLPSCRYARVHVEGQAFTQSSLSYAAAHYAALRERGIRDHESKWRVLEVVQRGDISAVKLDVVYQGVRYIDYLLLMRTAGGWRIAAAVWGDPTK